MAMVFQHFNLWPHRSVLQNIIEGPVQVLGISRKAATEKAMALLTRMGLAEKRLIFRFNSLEANNSASQLLVRWQWSLG
jgi:polar amino acid transport system ATP-binding protein